VRDWPGSTVTEWTADEFLNGTVLPGSDVTVTFPTGTSLTLRCTTVREIEAIKVMVRWLQEHP
jgi:hypothetical protein